MKANQLDTFDFYREAKLNYRHIVPSREDGLVLFYLYEKLEKGEYTNGEFTESEMNRSQRPGGRVLSMDSMSMANPISC